MRILILGDSLPLPRPGKGQPLKATWPALLKNHLPDCELWQRARTRFTINDVVKELGFFTESLPEFDSVIVQTGIVDCAPRPYPHLIAKILDVIVSMSTYRKIESFSHRRLLWLYGRAWVSERKFSHGIEQVVQISFQNNPRLAVHFIAIAPPSRTIVETLPGIDRAAKSYNAVLKATTSALSPRYGCRFIDPFESANPLDVTIEDGHHLSTRGHEIVADALLTSLATHPAQPQNANV